MIRTEDFDCGIMISASHNPYYDNGIKVMNGNGEKLEESVITEIEKYLDGEMEEIPLAKREYIGRTQDFAAGRNRYIGYLISIATRSFKGKKVGLDCSNGSASSVAKSVFDALGADTYVINDKPDGLNINRDCGSTHIENLQKFGVPVVVTLNAFVSDTEAETAYVEQFCKEHDCEFALAKVWEKGGEGGIALANKILETLEKKESHFHTLYSDDLGLKEKIETVAKEIYGADGVTYSPAAERELKRITDLGMANFPVCMAKTQYSLSDDAKKLGRPTGFKINVREVYVSAGAGFVVAVNGSIMTLPGLPKKPAAYGIDVNDDGVITGLF